MSEQSGRLLAALSDLSDRTVDEALDAGAAPRRARLRPMVAAAACLALLIGGGLWLLPRMGGGAASTGDAAAGRGRPRPVVGVSVLRRAGDAPDHRGGDGPDGGADRDAWTLPCGTPMG